MSSIELPEVADLEGLAARELERTLRDLDVARRRLDALIAETVGTAERSGAFGEDGHASISGWVKAACNWSSGDTKAAVQSARMLHVVPATREAAHSGLLGTSQMRLLARVFANPRCADQLPDSADLLLGHAASLWFDEFAVVVRRWEALADADGGHGTHERAHTRRDAHVSIVGEHVYLDARGGVVAGAMIEEIFGRFCDAEFHAEWDAGVALHGGRIRSVGQRGRRPGDLRAPPRRARWRQHSTARSAIRRTALTGHVRRIVFDTAGVVIDLGRRSRLFTGGARDAVLLGDRWCIWPGCGLRSGRCETDHSKPWVSHGPTRPDNGAPACARPNRWKQRGYRTARDENGHWHT
jgi:hypothetical protein